MDLVIDSGNTRTKFSLVKNGILEPHETFENNEFLDFLENTEALKKVKKTLISATSSAEYASKVKDKLSSDEIFMLDEVKDFPIQIDYDNKAYLGQDRIANACGAFRHFTGETCLIIDLGTCNTYDLLKNDTLIGGAISPGLRMRFKSMNDYSARLPRLEQIENEKFPGASTNESLEAGVFYGILGEIHQFIDESKQSEKDLNVLLTGGDAIRFEKAIKYPIFANPKLTLEGLYEILQHIT